jgi:hypothetical protein
VSPHPILLQGFAEFFCVVLILAEARSLTPTPGRMSVFGGLQDKGVGPDEGWR